MAKQGEIDYASKLGEAGQWHARHKPFSDRHCADNLIRMGSVIHLLPSVPARVLDAGCGSGWTTEFLGRRGYGVVGVDISPDMIIRADQRRVELGLKNASFLVSDFESLPFDAEFDAALFYDALHHAVDEEAALAAVYRALKPGGWCITCEPGAGHSTSEGARHAVATYGVTEKDMPPSKIIRVGKRVGFRKFRVYPHAHDLNRHVYASPSRFLPGLTARWEWFRQLYALGMTVAVQITKPWTSGTVVLVK
jgi:ubiquinone/menaquinone biosynthesis C-methylase UbiE